MNKFQDNQSLKDTILVAVSHAKKGVPNPPYLIII